MRSAVRAFAFSVFVAMAVTGCASGPTQQQIAQADYGSKPDQTAAETQIKAYFARVLKDPYSAQYEFSPAQQSYMVSSAFEGRQLYAGYVIQAHVNAKNSYGGYTGGESYQFLFLNGQMIRGIKIPRQGIVTTLF